MSLTKKEQYFLNDLEQKNKKLDQQIFLIEEENQKIEEEIECWEDKIEDLREQKNEKNWQLTFLNIITFGIFKYYKNKRINKEIKNLKIKSKIAREAMIENQKNTWPLKNQKLKVLEAMTTIKDLIIGNNEEKYLAISQKLDVILKKQSMQQVATSNSTSVNPFTADSDFDNKMTSYPREKNPFGEDEDFAGATPKLSVRQDSSDSGFGYESKLSNSIASKLNFIASDDSDQELISSCV